MTSTTSSMGTTTTASSSSKLSSSSSSSSSSSWSWWLLEGLGGTVRGSFFRAPLTVDASAKPGTTGLKAKSNDAWSLAKPYLSLSFFLYSPNLIWFLITSALWYCAPYDFDLVKSDLARTLRERILINLIVVWGYYGFWHYVLYATDTCHRPFAPDRRYRFSKVFHNAFYTTLGSIQWSLVEVGFMYLYGTGRLGYMNASEVFSSTGNLLWNVLWILLVPPIREIHFYFAHRMQHAKCLYKYVHALHHRNTDIEPFSGMSMHPTEHMYYFTCYGPLLLVGTLHPIVCMWMGIHVTISPAASHSGWEDHWQSDIMHYLHHAYFEVNYGTGAPLPLDQWFGTFADKLENAASFKTRADAKATLAGTPEHVLFWILGVIAPALLAYAALVHREWLQPQRLWSDAVIAGTLSAAPMAAAVFLHSFDYFKRSNTTSWMKHYLAPFDKNTRFSLAFHTAASVFASNWPVYQLVMMLLAEDPPPLATA